MAHFAKINKDNIVTKVLRIEQDVIDMACIGEGDYNFVELVNLMSKNQDFTKVNGIYEQDPIDNPKAKLLKNVSYSEVLNKNLKVMDLTAISLAKETKIPILVTSIFQSDSLINALKGIGEYSTIN